MLPDPGMHGDADDDGPGLIKLEMGEFGSGSMSDPLRHAVGLRTAQDQFKMKMWNSFPSIFQNTIFHGEQDPKIAALRHTGTVRERLEAGRALKEAGNEALRGASAGKAAAPRAAPVEEEALERRVRELEAAVAKKEEELRALRKELAAARSELEVVQAAHREPAAPPDACGGAQRERLEDAITKYEKAAGLLRYVECVRPDWKNDDGSYKGIEDEHLRVDASALEGEGPEVEEARELVTSCYLNIALACQKVEDYGRMRAACDEVLAHVNANCVKALYRRAQSRVLPTGALDGDRAAAIQDLHLAAQLAPQDKEVRGLLARLKAEKRSQEAKERDAFGGLFERGEVVKGDPGAKAERPPPGKKLDLNDPRVQAMLDIRPGPGGFLEE